MSVTASFSRDSKAYLSDGTEIRSGVPRFEPGKFSQAVRVEEGTANILSDPDDFTVSTWKKVGISVSSESDGFFKLVQDTSDDLHGVKQYFSVVENTYYGCQFRVKRGTWDKIIVMTSGYTNWEGNNGNETVFDLSSGTIIRTDAIDAGIERIDVDTYVIWIVGKTKAGIDPFDSMWNIYHYDSNSDSGVFVGDGASYFFARMAQAEKKPYATSFIDGTRSAETLTIPTEGVLKGLPAWTIEGWVRFNSLSYYSSGTLSYNVFWYMGESGDGFGDQYEAHLFRDTSGKLGFYTPSTSATSNFIVDTTDWACLAFVYDNGVYRLYANGVKIAEAVGELLDYSQLGNELVLNKPRSNFRFLNGLIDDLRISNIARTDEEIAAAYASGQPLPKDQYTTCKLTFDLTLRDKTDEFKVYDNTPDYGYIAWYDLGIKYKGMTYDIADGYSNAKYIWWDYDYPYVLQASDTLPTLADDDCLVFFNKNGTHLTVPKSTVVDGGLIVSESILADALAANSVTGVKIAAGSISTDKLAANAVGAEKIAAGAVVAEKIATGAVTSDKINVNELSAISGNLGTITAGTIESDVVIAGNAASSLETQSGAQSKADTAEQNANSYTNTQVANHDAQESPHNLPSYCKMQSDGFKVYDSSNDLRCHLGQYESGKYGLIVYDGKIEADVIVAGQYANKLGKTPATVVVADGSTTQDTKRADFAVPAGSTSAQETINAAINSLPASGGKVVLLEGTYDVDNSIVVPSNVGINMSPGTVIKVKDNLDSDIDVITNTDKVNGNSNIQINGGTIYGNKSNNSSGVQNGIYFKSVTSCKISTTVSDFRNTGICLESSINNNINNNICENNDSLGIKLYYSDGNTITGNTCNNNGNASGTYLTRSNNNTITGNTCSNNKWSGVFIDNSLNNTIVGNTCKGNGSNATLNHWGSGIFVIRSSGNNISGNVCIENYHDGICISEFSGAPSDGNNISNNNCKSNSQEVDATYDNISVLGDSNYNNIQKNTCRQGSLVNKPRYGISINSTDADGNIVTNNDLYNSGVSGSFSDAGTGTVTTAGNRL